MAPPTFGLNFLEVKKSSDNNFMLLCGFERFDKFFVRIDILERLFIHIMKNNSESSKEVRLVPEMLNLLGCTKDNFLKLMKIMNYKVFEKSNETFFRYSPKKKIKKDKTINEPDNPFYILNQLILK